MTAHFDTVSKPNQQGTRLDELCTQGGAPQTLHHRWVYQQQLRTPNIPKPQHVKRVEVEDMNSVWLKSLELARLGELDELDNVSQVPESGLELNHLRLSCHTNHEAEEGNTSTMRKVSGCLGVESPNLCHPFLSST
ncbi:hypothetical protein U1Q18_021751 [Sarracenia purpurea var. burkii]